MLLALVIPTLAMMCASALDAASTHSDSPVRENRVDPTAAAAEAYNTTYKHFACGTNASHASDHFLSTIHSLHQNDLAAQHSSGSGSGAAHAIRTTSNLISVPLYLHVVTTAANAQLATPAQLTAQFKVLNSAYAPYAVQFVLKNTSWTVNDAWAVGASATDDAAMKLALRQGTYAALNIYLQSDLAGGVLGKCTLPTDVGTKPAASTYSSDGCNIALGTVPAGPIAGYNMGKTAVHETGHWLGLLHTFEGYSCSGAGDYIADTAQESESTSGCPVSPWKNSCAGSRVGVDPIHNYMDYSIDSCYTKFTAGQQARWQALYKQYRLGN